MAKQKPIEIIVEDMGDRLNVNLESDKGFATQAYLHKADLLRDDRLPRSTIIFRIGQVNFTTYTVDYIKQESPQSYTPVFQDPPNFPVFCNLREKLPEGSRLYEVLDALNSFAQEKMKQDKKEFFAPLLAQPSLPQ